MLTITWMLVAIFRFCYISYTVLSTIRGLHQFWSINGSGPITTLLGTVRPFFPVAPFTIHYSDTEILDNDFVFSRLNLVHSQLVVIVFYFAFSHKILPGHSVIIHGSVLFWFPRQAFPSGGPSNIFLWDVLLPIPQDTEQCESSFFKEAISDSVSCSSVSSGTQSDHTQFSVNC